ncbi:MAG: sigma-70 family RNA polymerase sigma factor [Planctomycetes bacterium]|nr:sigma-70 family RNA polymerase sigma factor [Planctomycetota bacterium]
MAHAPDPAPLDALLAEARWLEGLARALVADREEARDLVQEVWTKAAARPPERLDAPRAWLATVLCNALRSRRRVERATEALDDDERRPAARHETGPQTGSSADVVARAEAQRLLVESVLALDEPWRSTVLWHHFDGESCEAIARRTRVPPSTVRNRLVEARARLRERLARKRTDWMSALLPLTLHPGAATAASSAGPVGVLLAVNTLTKVGVVAATGLVALGGWWTWSALSVAESDAHDAPRLSRVPDAPAVDGRSRAAEPETSARSALAADAPVPSSTAVAPPSPAPPRSGELLVRVLEDGRPYAAGGTARVGGGSREFFEALREQPLAQDGTASFDVLELRRGPLGRSCTVEATVDSDSTVQALNVVLDGDAGREVVLRVGTARVVGTVWDEHGNPVDGARVELHALTGTDRSTDGMRITRTDGRGAYRFERLPAGKSIARLSVDDPEGLGRIAREEVADVELAIGEERRLDFGRPSPSPAWTGRVLTRADAPPVARVWVRLQLTDGNQSSGLRRAAEDGSFELHALPGAYRAEVRFEDDWDKLARFDDVVIGERGLVRDLVLPGSRLHGRVTTAAGDALPGDMAELRVSARIEGHDYPAAFHSCTATSTGEFTLDGLPPGTYRLSTNPLELVPESDALRVTITDSDVVVEASVSVKAP